MVDCGCTMTRTRSGGTLNSRQALMTSKPLFIRVAESMVMRLPIFQGGWFSAWATVILAKSARGVCRNGPPEAVSHTRSTSSLPPRLGCDEFAGHHQAFLVGQPHGLPGFDRLVGSFKAGDADDGADDEIDLGMGGDADGTSRTVEDFNLRSSIGVEFRPQRDGIGFPCNRHHFRLVANGLLVDRLNIRSRRQGHNLKAVGIAVDDAACARSE